MTSGFFERQKNTDKLHWIEPQVQSPASWYKSLDEFSQVLPQTASDFCTIENLTLLCFQLKNPQMKSPVLYFCLWRVNLHEVLLSITDIAENLHKIFFSG